MNSYNNLYSKLVDLSNKIFDEIICDIVKLPIAGGNRIYYRLNYESGRSVIGVIADDIREAQAFVRLSDIFAKENIKVPEIYGYSEDYSIYLEEDLGPVSLFDMIGDSKVEENIRKTLSMLVKMQTVAENKWKDAVAFSPLSGRLVMWDLNYFKYEFLKPSGVLFDENLLEDDFENLCKDILAIPAVLNGFMMRDCQSRNVMLHPEPYFIDYQGGRKGPCLYDAISLLWQARAGFSSEIKSTMMDYYAECFASERKISKESVLEYKNPLLIFRTLQVLGAYGFRGLVEKRAHFISSIPAALTNLSELFNSGCLDVYPELKSVAQKLFSCQRFTAISDDRLRVKVFSFSYKRGYPEDLTGNGGGFMFDCRGMHNPGRYDEYKSLTGRDLPVKEFLKEHGEADVFAYKAFDLVKPSVERYIKRGFKSLQIGFGCTGGQHRSVYCAEMVANLLAQSFPEALIELIHREQHIIEEFNQ